MNNFINKIFDKITDLLAKKMEHGAKMLSAGKSVGQIAEVLGYSTPYNFSRAFKRQYGVAPREYGRGTGT